MSRFGFAVGRRLGKAVQRNRLRRQMRESVRRQLPSVAPGWDVVFISRPSMGEASGSDVAQAVQELLGQAGLLQE